MVTTRRVIEIGSLFTLAYFSGQCTMDVREAKRELDLMPPLSSTYTCEARSGLDKNNRSIGGFASVQTERNVDGLDLRDTKCAGTIDQLTRYGRPLYSATPNPKFPDALPMTPEMQQLGAEMQTRANRLAYLADSIWWANEVRKDSVRKAHK